MFYRLLLILLFTPCCLSAAVWGIFEYDYEDSGVVITACSEANGLVEIPESINTLPVLKIGAAAFVNKTNLSALVLPDSLRSIGALAFSGCSSLVSIDFGEGLNSIDVEAFWSCSSLLELRLPDSLTSLSSGAFAECTSLENVFIPNSLSSLEDSVFENCDSLETIYVPSSVTKIGNLTFSGSETLKNVVLNYGLESIGDSAFEACDGLETINLPSSISSLGSNVFASCESLVSVLFSGNLPELGENVFQHIKPAIHYYADRNGFEQEQWSEFKLVEQGSYIWRDAVLNRGGNVIISDWYSWFYSTDYPTIYHPKHGYQSCFEDTATSLYVWDYAIGAWFWTDQSIYPWIYLFKEDKTGYYWFSTDGTAGNRWFLDPKIPGWVFETHL